MSLSTTLRRPVNPAVTPRAVVWSTFVLTLIGIGLSSYLTYVHYVASSALICPANGVIDCASVITGPYSSAFGIPFALLGLGFFVGMAVLCSPWAWAQAVAWPHLARLVGACTGALFICYLIYIEFVVKDHICLWCTGVHLCTFVLFVLCVTSVPKVLSESVED